MYKYFSRDGKILPVENATISLSNIEYSYGFGVYELIKVRNDVTYFAKEHVIRLLHSASIIGLPHSFSGEKILTYISELLAKDKTEICNIKLLLIGGKTAEESQLFILLLSPLFPDRKYYNEGVKTITHHSQRLFPNAKTLSMLGSYLAYKKAKENNCYDALLSKNEKLIEGTRTNFFAIKDKTLFTQPDDEILQGITRSTVMHVAKKNNYQIVTEDICKNELVNFDGAFLTSTTAKILPIKQIDDFMFPEIPKNLKLLIKKHDQFLEDSKGFFNP